MACLRREEQATHCEDLPNSAEKDIETSVRPPGHISCKCVFTKEIEAFMKTRTLDILKSIGTCHEISAEERTSGESLEKL